MVWSQYWRIICTLQQDYSGNPTCVAQMKQFGSCWKMVSKYFSNWNIFISMTVWRLFFWIRVSWQWRLQQWCQMIHTDHWMLLVLAQIVNLISLLLDQSRVHGSLSSSWVAESLGWFCWRLGQDWSRCVWCLRTCAGQPGTELGCRCCVDRQLLTLVTCLQRCPGQSRWVKFGSWKVRWSDLWTRGWDCGGNCKKIKSWR